MFMKLMYISALALLCFAGLAYLGTLFWWADLFAHFRPHMAVASAILAFGFLFCRRTWASLACAALVGAVLVPVLADLTYGDPQTPTPDIRVLAWNVHHRHSDPPSGVEMMRARDADVLILSETSPKWQRVLTAMSDMYPYQLHADVCDSVGCQVSLLSKRPWRSVESEKFAFDTPPVIWALFDRPGGGEPFYIVAVHIRRGVLPHGARQQRKQIAALGDLIRSLDGDIVMGGDMNATPSSAVFRSICTATALQGTNIGLSASWPALLGPFGISIDHFLTRGIDDISVQHIGAHGSDHVAIEAAINLGR
ncbi:MAG: endonuclease/exonuclease/phosphatase family protein [Rhodospirillales bacterium]|nr:endonuclease/exonuclease/phosphatase family protein [Rhodospirillales bacterium]MBO6788467.1 endonuclease/exonuclease/phosphatase family protein [Rhodospirillales bacterium]